jgi:transposase
MDAYSQDLRNRVLRVLARGDRPTAIANPFEVSRVWVYQVRNRLTQTGQRGSLPIGGHRRSRLVGMEPTLRAWLKETGDLTLAELCARLAEHGIAIKVPALWHQLDKWTLTHKNPLHASEQEHADVQAARREWQATQPALDITKLVFLVETGVSTNRARRYGRAPRGERCVGSVPHGQWTPPPSSPDCGMMTSPPRWWRMAP